MSYPELLDLPGRDVLLDGEVVVFADGLPSFGALAERMHVRNARRAVALAETRPVTYLVFDVLRLDGRDLTREPLSTRREVLAALGLDDAWARLPHVKRLLDEINLRPAAERVEKLRASHTFKAEIDADARRHMFPQNERLAG